MNDRGKSYTSVEDCVEDTLSRVGKRVVLATPLGVGNANHVVNELYRRAREDRTLDLRIVTALTLERPRWKNGLEQRLIEPLAERIFGNYPDLRYALGRRAGGLPPNVEVIEFFYPPGSLLDNESAQENYISSNYTHVVRDLSDFGVNVLAQLIAREEGDRFSLSCNSDLSLDLLDEFARREAAGEAVAVLGQVHPQLPFMYGDAELGAESFHGILDSPRYHFDLFGPPNPAVSSADYMIAMHTACLVKDGGTLQLGIGSMGDAVTYTLQLRHEQNRVFRNLVDAAGMVDVVCDAVAVWGGLQPFERGLYASTEMLVDGYLELYRSGILKRKVYGDAALQRVLDLRRGDESVDRGLLEALIEQGAVAAKLTEADVVRLQRWGVLREDLEFRDGRIRGPGARVLPVDLADPRALAEVAEHGLGNRLRGGVLAHAGFFLGPREFYRRLASMPRREREQFHMTRISFVNQLYGCEELKRAQRKDARFLNSGLMATATGAVVSDGLEDGRVLSGVGGQYNFVAMAHALEDGRSILMIRAVRERDGDTASNVVWNYGHTTIPRHLRDIVVTEYGIADLRGKRDREVVEAMIAVADSRFQEGLVRDAVRARKLPKGYRVPERYRSNHPERLERLLAPYRERGLFVEFPYGTDYTDEEIVLAKALRAVARKLKSREFSFTDLSRLGGVVSVPTAAEPYLQRLGLGDPSTIAEIIMQKAALFGLELVDAI